MGSNEYRKLSALTTFISKNILPLNWETGKTTNIIMETQAENINLVFGDYSGQVTFTGERKVEWVEVSPSVNADSMRLELKDVYPGTSWEDTCISEVTVYAE